MKLEQKIRENLKYDPETGIITNLITRSSRSFKGSPALNTYSEGYYCGTFFYKILKAHRVAWFLHYGEWPEGEIDHINGDKLDNRICNLRAVSRSQNEMNKPKAKNNTSGVRGVSLDRRSGKWKAYITKGRTRFDLGTFALFAEAVSARKLAENNLHGEYTHKMSDDRRSK